MPEQMSDEEIYRVAKKRVEDKRGFFVHLAVYCVVNLFLIIIWAVTSRDFPWFVFPLVGWGIGITLHGLNVFIFTKQSDWERRQIEKEVEKLRKRQ